MATRKENVWMVRAGSQGHRIDEFERGYIGIGWKLEDDRPGTVQNAAGVFHKFRSVLEVGDKVITYDPGKREY